MFGELGFAGVNIMDDLTEMVDVAFGIEGIGGDFKGNPMLARHFLCKNREGCRHRKPHLGADLLHAPLEVGVHPKIHVDCICHSDAPPL